MTLTPQDIEAQVFREKFKGYDQDEVDAFLDRVSDRLGELIKERDGLLERMQSVEADARESIEAERLLKRTLITAQRTADETVAEAVAQAQATIAETDQRAAQIMADAEARAAQLVGDAERTAAETVMAGNREAEAARAAAEQQLRQVQGVVAELQRFRSEYRDRVRAAVAEQLAVLDGMGDVPEVPPEMARLAASAAEPAAPPAAPPSALDHPEPEPDVLRIQAAPEMAPPPNQTAPPTETRISGLHVGDV